MLLIYAGMMKLVNMLDLGSSAARLVGSSPTTRTIIRFTPKRKLGAHQKICPEFFKDYP